MKIEWVDGFEIRVSIDDGTVLISANKEGLLSLAGQLIALAEEPAGNHIHYDEHNSLEEGSAELIIERMRDTAEDLQLHIPNMEDGWFYQKMMSDPATMSYNAPWFPPDGCIPNPEEEWVVLQKEWIGKEPVRFYAFLQRTSDGTFVGDVNYHYNPTRDWYDMGIVIYAPERGKGYGKQGLRLLLDRAFRVDGISRLHNDFETSRGAACRIHRDVGFREVGIEDGILQLELTREEYFSSVLPEKIN